MITSLMQYASDELLDIREAAALLRVSETSLRRWTNAGQLPCLRIGGRHERRFRRADLLAFVEGPSSATSTGPLCQLYTSELSCTRPGAELIAVGLQAGRVCILSPHPDVTDAG